MDIFEPILNRRNQCLETYITESNRDNIGRRPVNKVEVEVSAELGRIQDTISGLGDMTHSLLGLAL